MIDTPLTQQHFNNAAETYNQAAFLQREIGARLLERLSLLKQKPQVVLDLGAGTGYFHASLQKLFPKAFVFGLDLALNMSRVARKEHPENVYVCADAHRLPFPDSSIDCIYSNCVLQWTDIGQMLAECRRVLRPEGSLFVSTFGPNTLKELKASWAEVDKDPHTHAFPDMHDIGDALLQCRYQDPVTDREEITVTYADVRQLMRDLKALGAQNSDPNRSKGLTSRTKMQKLVDAYETRRRADNTLPATYEIIYLHALVPQGPTRNKDGTLRYRSTNIDYAER